MYVLSSLNRINVSLINAFNQFPKGLENHALNVFLFFHNLNVSYSISQANVLYDSENKRSN